MEFNPNDFSYDITSEQGDVLLFQKIIIGYAKEKFLREIKLLDFIELQYWNKPEIWCIFIEAENLKRFIPYFDGVQKLVLFVGEINNDFDFRFIMAKIVKDPEKIAMLGSSEWDLWKGLKTLKSVKKSTYPNT